MNEIDLIPFCVEWAKIPMIMAGLCAFVVGVLTGVLATAWVRLA